MMKIIDFHTHQYLTEEQNSGMYQEAYRLSPMEQKEQLERAGITGICGSVIMPVNSASPMETIRECNRSAMQLKNVLGDFYHSGIHVHPFFIKEFCEEIQ